ncbi:hypothetical protein ALC62_15373 [Cyphomyrmex costatus]|uniref:MADF domain-containing protein n=1 Tax=Cyphomyrmex costatus TaxID=456900 RepID=A0A151I789_9HYME|nr:hypothetical protein ALC62_15373 [Cyphomyrmex costatus]
MSDHQSYCSTNESSNFSENVECFDDSENIIIEEKGGDEFLIALYRERPFLYDKKNPNFKDTLMKENAWNEISKTMITTNCGDFYTPDYCQKRCTSLREQYNREKKRIENQSKSGSAASSSNCRKFLFFSQLTFLDQFIKRRRTYSNVIKTESSESANEKNLDTETCESSDISTSSSTNKENQSTNFKQTVNVGNSHQKVSVNSPKLKRQKMNETKQLEQSFFNMSNKIMNYMETSKSADNAFMEFIKIQFDSIPEYEKNIRRKMIIDAISTPL